jgi:hypothetical protein
VLNGWAVSFSVVAMTTTTLLVRKDQLAESRLATREDAPLTDGQVRVRVDAFALTANNITYAAFGDAMNYWQFFPTGEDGWGIVPVWGFGTVVQSLHPGVAVGERLWGYWPMANSAVLSPARLSESGFMDGAPHRAELHGVYNQYLRCSTDPFYTPDSEAEQALLRPLFATSWLIDDFLADNDFFGAKAALLSSASSKTAYGTAWCLKQREGIEVIGLTSPGNVAFCESLGCYSRVLTYAELDRIAADTPCVYVDFAGNAGLRRQIHERFANLRYSCSVGGTHVKELGGAKDLPGPRATLFFAPAQSKKRSQDWGPAVLGERLVASWKLFRQHATDPAKPWLRVQRHEGTAEVQKAYGAMVAGQGDPISGHILRLG